MNASHLQWHPFVAVLEGNDHLKKRETATKSMTDEYGIMISLRAEK
jgi:hypothetical protein